MTATTSSSSAAAISGAAPSSSSSCAADAGIYTRHLASHGIGMMPSAVNPSGEEGTLIALVERYLSLSLHRNATFLAERLNAAFPCARNTHLLATCYYRQGDHGRAFAMLMERKRAVWDFRRASGSYADQVAEEASKYLLALCAWKIGELKEAESALLNGQVTLGKGEAPVDMSSMSPKQLSDVVLRSEKCPIPNGAAGLYLLGRICLEGSRHEHAIEYFALALKLDAFMFDAYEQLCALGAVLPPTAFFGVGTDADGELGATSTVTAPLPLPTLVRATVSSAGAYPPYEFVHMDNTAGSARKGSPPNSPCFRLTPTSERGWATPAPALASISQPLGSIAIEDETLTPKGKRKKRPFSSARKSSNVHDRDRDDNFDAQGPRHVPNAVCGSIAVLGLLRQCGDVSLMLSQYNCEDAIKALKRLPACHFSTGWAMHKMGKAYFELANYEKAHATFKKMISCDPHRTEGLDVYSTNLWHLKKEVELCYLAQSVTEMNRRAPETWIVVGNCFALQKEHDVAISFFKRALQLNPSFTYAHTLSGHEYVSNEDFEKAVACYRHSIRLDPRHYNAWFGLASIFYRQEKYDLAEYHFRRAIEINPCSSVLHCYLGMVLHSSGDCEGALAALSRAAQLGSARNPQARYQKAAVLRSMGRYSEALEELRCVNDYAPREASVNFLMGKISKQMGDIDSALAYFNSALDLDTKDSYMI